MASDMYIKKFDGKPVPLSQICKRDHPSEQNPLCTKRSDSYLVGSVEEALKLNEQYQQERKKKS